jgi:uncharacterized protein
MRQVWHDLLFAHWPIQPDRLRPLVPSQLVLDTFDRQSWVGVVPFRMSDVCLRGILPMPRLSRFPELNVRTYVTYGDKPGVYFFSLDAASLPAVWTARRFYRLPYFYASMRSVEENGQIHYASRRHANPADFRATYQSTSQVRAPANGSLEHWLTERYCLYTVHNREVCCCEIHHPPWPLQDATAEFQVNTMAASAGIELPRTTSLLHFSRQQDVLIWPLHRADETCSRV